MYSIRADFNIPKLHSMMHYLGSLRALGSANGYNTESPERLHIDYAKDGYRASNGVDYIAQMTKWLQRQEAVDRHTAYLDWVSKLKSRNDLARNPEDSESVTQRMNRCWKVIANTVVSGQASPLLALHPGTDIASQRRAHSPIPLSAA
jgi:hypothetical protein